MKMHINKVDTTLGPGPHFLRMTQRPATRIPLGSTTGRGCAKAGKVIGSGGDCGGNGEFEFPPQGPKLKQI